MSIGSALRTLAGLLLVMVIPALVLVPLLATSAQAPTGQVVVAAVVDRDTAQTVGGTHVALGRDLVRRLTDESTEVKWVQVTETDARRGVQSGRYVAMVTVPTDFTAKTLAAAAGQPVEPQVALVTSSLTPAARPVVSYSLARATSQTVGAAALDKVFVTVADGNAAFKAASDQAGGLAKTAAELDEQGKQVDKQAGEVDSKLGQVGEQGGQLGKGPGLPSLTGTQQQLATANQQAGTSGALSLEAQRAIANAAAEAERSKEAGQTSAKTVAELDRLAKQLDQQATDQQAGVSGYTASVAAAAQRQRAIDASLRGMKTQLASFSNQLKDVTGATSTQPASVPKSLQPTKVTKADGDGGGEDSGEGGDGEGSLKEALAALQALVNQLETDQSPDTAVSLATELKALADQHDSGLDDLEERLKDLRRLYANSNWGNDANLPVKCPYAWHHPGVPWDDCRAWRAGVVTGLDLSLDELDKTQVDDKSQELRTKAAQNLQNVTAIKNGRDDLVKAARNAVVAVQNAIANGTPVEEVIEKVAEIADEAEVLSTTAQTLSSDSDEQTAALEALDTDSPAVQQLSSAAATMNVTLAEQDEQIATLNATVADLSSKLDGLTTVVTTLNKQTGELQTTGAGLRATLQQLQTDQKTLQADLDGAKTTIQEQDERLARLSGSTAEAQAAGKALAKQLEQMREQTSQVKQETEDHSAALQKNGWPTLDPSSKQRLSTLLIDQPEPEAGTVDGLGWKALVTTIAIWVGGLAGSYITGRLLSRRRGGELIATALTTGVVAGSVCLGLLPQVDARVGPLVAVVVVGSLAAAVVAQALRLAVGNGGVWVGLGLLGVTVLAFTPASPAWLDTVRDWSVTTPLLDALRVTLAGGGAAGPQLATMLAWTAVAVVVAVLASKRFRSEKA